MNAEERGKRISEAAYYRAERRGFTGNGQLDDWLEAEREFEHLLTPFPDAIPSEGPATENESRDTRDSNRGPLAGQD